MKFYYFDSSALVKNYIDEVGSGYVKSILNSPDKNLIYTVVVSKVEVASAFIRWSKSFGSEKTAQPPYGRFKEDFDKYFRVIDVDKDIIESAVFIVEQNGLRGYDAIQLAAALSLSASVIDMSLSPINFVCADNELNYAAQLEGLEVVNPNEKF
jgi:predicted nucleic acid-binding protein